MITDAFQIKKQKDDGEIFRYNKDIKKVEIKSRGTGKWSSAIVEGYKNTFYYVKSNVSGGST